MITVSSTMERATRRFVIVAAIVAIDQNRAIEIGAFKPHCLGSAQTEANAVNEVSRRAISMAGNAMNKPKLLAVALALGGLMMPVPTAAQTALLTTAFFEKNKVPPRSAARLHATIFGKTVSIRALEGGAVEQVYYGAQRIGAGGEKTKYRIREGGIEEEHGGVPRMLLIYDWHGHAYGCVENIGDLDELAGAEGTCPYEIVATAQDDHTRGK